MHVVAMLDARAICAQSVVYFDIGKGVAYCARGSYCPVFRFSNVTSRGERLAGHSRISIVHFVRTQNRYVPTVVTSCFLTNRNHDPIGKAETCVHCWSQGTIEHHRIQVSTV